MKARRSDSHIVTSYFELMPFLVFAVAVVLLLVMPLRANRTPYAWALGGGDETPGGAGRPTARTLW